MCGSPFFGEHAHWDDDGSVNLTKCDNSLLAKLPPTLLFTAEYDPLRTEGEAFAERLFKLGVPTSSYRMLSTIHGFWHNGDQPLYHPYSDLAVQTLAKWKSTVCQ